MKRILFTQSRPPHGGINAQEGLDAILMGSAFAECAVLFQGDGVYQLLKHQQPERLGTKNFASTFGALADYGVDQIFCIDEDLASVNLEPMNWLFRRYPLNKIPCANSYQHLIWYWTFDDPAYPEQATPRACSYRLLRGSCCFI